MSYWIPCQNCGIELPSDWSWYVCDKCGFRVVIRVWVAIKAHIHRAVLSVANVHLVT